MQFSSVRYFGFSSQMSSHDCFEMGRQSYLNSDYYHTSLWMNEAMARLNNNTNETTSIPKADILEYLAFSVFKQGKHRHGEKSPKVNLKPQMQPMTNPTSSNTQ